MAEQRIEIEVEDEVLNMMKTELHHLDFAREDDEESWAIHRVLHSIRDEHSKDYDPQIISIGPLHVEKTALEPMKSLKWRYLQDLLHRCQDDRDNMLKKYISKVRELEAQARKRYAEGVDLDIDDFVQIMVLDACFIIELLIRRRYGAWKRERAHEVEWYMPLLRNDLLLVENQIPFFIVQSLFELSNIPDVPDLEKLAISYVTSGKPMSIPGKEDPKKAHHLLHLFQLSFLPTSPKMITTAPSWRLVVMSTIKKIGSVASGSFFWLLASLLYCRRLPLECSKCHQQQLTDEERIGAPGRIPSATELADAGVQFKRKKAMSLLNVTFRDGVMKIPFLTINYHTAPQFRNLIAFEHWLPSSKRQFTSYAVLLDNLINTPKDVAILKKCGVIESMLSRDEDVADLFNSLCQGTYLNYETHYLAQLFKEVNQCYLQYCEVDRHRWRAKLMRDYFATPWSTISVIAASILLFLAVVQIVYAILAYHKPKK